MKRKLLKIYELISELNEAKFLHSTGRMFYLRNNQYYTDTKCQNRINKQLIDEFNEAERLKHNAEKTISFIIHK